MKKLNALALAAVLSIGAAAPALAQQDEFVFVVDRTDISSDRTAQEIYAELVATAGEYCAQFGDARQQCMVQMIELALGEIGDEALTRVHAEVTAQQSTVMTASYSGD